MQMRNSGLAQCSVYPGRALSSMCDTKALNLFCTFRFGWRRSCRPAARSHMLPAFTITGVSIFHLNEHTLCAVGFCFCRVSVRILSISLSLFLMLHSLLTSFGSFFTRWHSFSARARMQSRAPSSLASVSVGDPWTPCSPGFVWEEDSDVLGYLHLLGLGFHALWHITTCWAVPCCSQ